MATTGHPIKEKREKEKVTDAFFVKKPGTADGDGPQDGLEKGCEKCVCPFLRLVAGDCNAPNVLKLCFRLRLMFARPQGRSVACPRPTSTLACERTTPFPG